MRRFRETIADLRQWNRDFTLLAVAVFAMGGFFGVTLTLFNNFIVERLSIEAHELGLVEALREVPGFLNVGFVALVVFLPGALVGAVCLLAMGLGIGAYGWIDSVTTLALLSLVWSLGFHCWVPFEQNLALTFSPPGAKGRWLGQLRSVNSIAWLMMIGACILLLPHIGYRGMFIFASILTGAGGVALLFARRDRAHEKARRIVVKRRYGLYYALNFLQGCRKQMFITFAIFALVKVHGMPVQVTMWLVLINQALITFTAPLMGRLIDRHGERSMLSLSYGILFFVFLGYAVVVNRPALYVLYCIDNLVFFGGIALTTYLHRICPAEELTPTLAMGVTMNHVAAVLAPLLGGLAWHYFGYRVIFFSGAVLALISLIVTQRMAPHVSEETSDESEPSPLPLEESLPD